MKIVTFNLFQSRKGFIWTGLQFIWAGIVGDKCVWVKNIECDEVIDNTVAVKGAPITGSNKDTLEMKEL